MQSVVCVSLSNYHLDNKQQSVVVGGRGRWIRQIRRCSVSCTLLLFKRSRVRSCVHACCEICGVVNKPQPPRLRIFSRYKFVMHYDDRVNRKKPRSCRSWSFWWVSVTSPALAFTVVFVLFCFWVSCARVGGRGTGQNERPRLFLESFFRPFFFFPAVAGLVRSHDLV